MNKIPIVLDKQLLERNFSQYISWAPNKAPHGIIVGATGTGKTYLCKLILGKLGIYLIDAELYVCDYKGDEDFTFLTNKHNFYRFKECTDGFLNFYERFLKRQQGEDKSRTPLFLFFDEYASFLNGIQDKKMLEQCKLAASDILMMGRSYNIHLLIAQQRADAEYFKSARDNLTLRIGLGNLSSESAKMLFPDYIDKLTPDKGQGLGYMSDGQYFYEIAVPAISDMNKLHNAILSIVH